MTTLQDVKRVSFEGDVQSSDEMDRTMDMERVKLLQGMGAIGIMGDESFDEDFRA